MEDIFRSLERTLRLAGDGGEWLFLEPLDHELLSELENIIINCDVPEASSESVGGQAGSVKDQAENRGDAAQLPPKEETVKSSPAPNLNPEDADTLYSLRLRLRDCALCPLCLERKNVVFGQGNMNADVMLIGEAPGADEDRTGRAFVGKAGQLLTQIIQSIGLNREEVYICNVIKCRPPGNRNPGTGEIKKCSPFLFKQIDILKPKLIVVLGAVALKTILPQSPGITKVRGRLGSFKGIPLLPTFHPSYLLRNTSALSLVWNDMRQVRQILYRISAGIGGKPEEA